MAQVRIELAVDTAEIESEFAELVPDIESASLRARRAVARRLRKIAVRELGRVAGIHYEPTVKRRISPHPRNAPFPTVWLGGNPANAWSFHRSQVVELPNRPEGEQPRGRDDLVGGKTTYRRLLIDGHAIPNAYFANPHGVPFFFVPDELQGTWSSPVPGVELNRGGVVTIEIDDAVEEVATRLQGMVPHILREEFLKALEGERVR